MIAESDLKIYESSSLYKRLKKGSDEAFQNIYQKYRKNIDYLIRSRIKKPCDAEDLVQDVFMKIWEYRREIDENRPIKNLLYRISLNAVYSYNSHLDVIKRNENYLATNLSLGFNSSDSILIFKETDSIIKTIINRLPKKQQDIYKMHIEEGLSRQQIAKEKGLSVRTVDNQLYRAKMKMKEVLSQN
ncbi:RNA polymerase sigma factor [Sunxiuqinia sp. A32]|uniref:RNA polymerase sigma factor n=1 Tax=Sunxiuqinia sp. A32 TaxID=3461496 RepID=UPI0040457B62